ncbi:predicted protein [Streptomyces viridosporus ATCC 14672]|uniref:Predicted protein n=1 Tax=Streptomyces viridosporus (strain ATCC 14672 / DSM 40746 / JCM 4963 / KCTC 9882 / NRRL B-12104 / FH 1290) TaxID=566461 RepID=D6A8J5_STRV1|nr:predicted protein [Streptomyces viridosporus ATCC 14672]
MSDPYRGRRSGRSAAFPNLWATQSHPGVDGLDPAPTTTRHFNNRASCSSLDSTTASYQEALLPCLHVDQLTRSSIPFEPGRADERIENSQLGPLRRPVLARLAPPRHPRDRRPRISHRTASGPKSTHTGLTLY